MTVTSMTGYATTEMTIDGIPYRLEIRSVNHRHLDLRCRLPRQLNAAEVWIGRQIRRRFGRGRIELSINREPGLASQPRVAVDRGLARAYFDALQELADQLGHDQVPSLELIARMPDVIAQETPSLDPDAVEQHLLEPLERAFTALESMREQEGAHLAAELDRQNAELRRLSALAAERSPGVIVEARERLRAKVVEMLGDPTNVDENRMLQEVVIQSDRLDISEEIARLSSHCDQFDRLLAKSGPHGKKLDFLLQEMNRESNTIASKSNDIELSHTAVEMKCLVEKMREQVQNIQ